MAEFSKMAEFSNRMLQLKGRVWMQQDNLDLYSGTSDAMLASHFRARANQGNLRIAAPGEGNLVSSMTSAGFHLPILDLDFPHLYVPSTTPGHGHLYLNHKVLSSSEYFVLMSVLYHHGVVGRGAVEQLKAYDMSMVRPPGTVKHLRAADPNDGDDDWDDDWDLDAGR